MTVPEAKVYNVQGENVGEVQLNETIFGAGVRPDLISDVARALMASRRQGTASTKTRGEVRGSGAKPWRQKGTGRARAGTRRSPIWEGGGVVFGPHPRDYSYRTPRKVRRFALKSMLSAKVEAGELLVLEGLNCTEPRTKNIARVLEALPGGDGKVLIILAEPDMNVVLSGRNIPRLRMVLADNVNVLDLLAAGRVVVLREAIAKLESRLS